MSFWDAFLGKPKKKRKSPPRSERIAAMKKPRTGQLEEYRKSGVVFAVRVLPAKDACEACKKLAGLMHSLSSAPALPHPGCTREWCRCVYIPVVKGMSPTIRVGGR